MVLSRSLIFDSFFSIMQYLRYFKILENPLLRTNNLLIVILFPLIIETKLPILLSLSSQSFVYSKISKVCQNSILIKKFWTNKLFWVQSIRMMKQSFLIFLWTFLFCVKLKMKSTPPILQKFFAISNEANKPNNSSNKFKFCSSLLSSSA